MIEVRTVSGRRMKKQFARFPNKIFKNDPHYVPPFEYDEFHILNPKKNASLEDADAECFLAYRDGKVVGRVMGIVSHLFNKKNGTKYARISRYDAIDDDAVAKALLCTVESWAQRKGMDTIHGPLGFNDLEREGLMVDGWDVMGTFQCSYHAPWYQKQFEQNGYTEDAKWIEWRLFINGKCPEKIERVANVVEKRYGYYEKRFKTTKELIEACKKDVFKMIDECYSHLYGTVPFTDKLIEQTIQLFKIALDKDYISLVYDKDDKLAAFGLGYGSLAEAMHKSKGRYLPFGVFRMLHAIKHPKVVELGLVAVRPDLQGTGVLALVQRNLVQRLIKNKIEYCEAGQELVDNEPVQKAFAMFDRKVVRTKICYKKSLKEEKK